MKLLILSNNPDRASFRQRIAVYIDSLRANGVDCEVAKLPRGLLSCRKLFLQAKDFDGVFLHKKALNPFDAYYLTKYGKKIIYDFDDAVMYDDNRPERTHRKRQNSFRRTVLLADLVIAGNEYLAEHARKFNDNIKILPTGLDISEYDVKITRPNDGKIRLVWIGSKVTLPYLKEIGPALEEIGSRLKNVVLRVISDEFIELNNMRIENRTWSRQTQARDLAECDIGLAPLANNRFTRGKCGFKILQYAAAGLPTITSPVGVNAEMVRDGVTGCHAITVKDWVDKIAALVNNKSLRVQMGQTAGQMARSFDSDVIGRRLVALVREAIKNA